MSDLDDLTPPSRKSLEGQMVISTPGDPLDHLALVALVAVGALAVVVVALAAAVVFG